MPHPRLTPAIVALTLATAVSLPAQTTTAAAGVGAMLQRADGGFWQSFTRFEPAMRFSNSWMQLDGSATVGANGRAMEFKNGGVDLLAETPNVNGYRVSSVVHDERVNLGAGITRSIASYESALSFASNGSGAWLGMASEQTNLVGQDATPHLRFGVWHQFKDITASVGTAEHSLHIDGTPARIEKFTNEQGFSDSTVIAGTAARIARWSSLESRIDWASGRMAAQARFGVQSLPAISKPSIWSTVSATYAATEQFTLVGSIGTDASRAAYGVPTWRFASIGVRVAPAALAHPMIMPHVRPTVSAFSVRASDDGYYVLTMHVPSARTVELSGDFNGWKPVALRQVGADAWETTIAVKPGTYHVNTRVNGDAWIAPPGLSSTVDEFNGTVGLLVIR